MIQTWNIVDDDIEESGPPQGDTRIEATIDWRAGESAEHMIRRGVEECYAFRGDPDGYHCIHAMPHPRNTSVVRVNLRPIYLKSFSCIPDKESPVRFWVSMKWDVPENIQGGVQERLPPRRGQWSENRQSLFDPDPRTGTKLHTTTAGEVIKGLQDTFQFPTLSYSYRMDSLPRWFEDAQAGCVNEDSVYLDGKTYGPNTLQVSTAVAEPFLDPDAKVWRDIYLEIAVNPDGWDRQIPNIGYYELKLYALRWEKKTPAPGANPTPYAGYGFVGNPIDPYPYITSQQALDRLFRAARENRAVKLAGQTVKIRWSYEPIMTILNPKGDQEAKEVDKPVPLDANGAALRDWNPGFDYQTGIGELASVSNPRPIPLRTLLKPEDVIILKRRTRKTARMSEWGLW